MTEIVFNFSRTSHIRGTAICSTCQIISFIYAMKGSKSTFHWWEASWQGHHPGPQWRWASLRSVFPSHWSGAAAAATVLESGHTHTHTHTQNQQCEIKAVAAKLQRGSSVEISSPAHLHLEKRLQIFHLQARTTHDLAKRLQLFASRLIVALRRRIQREEGDRTDG